MKKKQQKLRVYGLTLGLIAALLIITTSCGSKAATTTTRSTVVSTTASKITSTAATTTKSALGASTTTQYANPEYVVKVLPQWTVNSANAKDITVNSPNDPNTYVRVITSLNPVTSLDSYLSSCVSLFKFEFPTYAEQSRTKITVNGLPAYSLNVTFTKDGVPLKGVVYVIVKGTQGYCAVGMAMPANWSKYSADLTTILNSLIPK